MYISAMYLCVNSWPWYLYVRCFFLTQTPPLSTTSQATPGQGSGSCFCAAAAQISTAMVDDGISVTGAEGLSSVNHLIQIYLLPLTRGGGKSDQNGILLKTSYCSWYVILTSVRTSCSWFRKGVLWIFKSGPTTILISPKSKDLKI